ncbi:nuclear pore complex protein NUP1-like isoform X2 [Rhododendron vialii]|uniref:nuclear pore complex protein NUP1-like isoform X2 n=1 Tax=Rhododendron vialii TaxID=182163 RepID=UPI00265FC2F5|nr:nuclear pore complex protein NUP1-like isoform X2 [Rhododendron vialii]
MKSGEGTSYGGGVGGKFRKTPSRRHQPTPYDRPPPTPFPNPRNNNGWLPKLILSGARSFFSSFSQANIESRDRLQDAVPINSARVEAPAIDNGGNPTNSCNDSSISKLEQILQQKTFSRSEVDRLTELLHSKPIDVPTGDDHKMGEVNVPQSMSAYGVQQNVSSSPMQHHVMEMPLENRFRGHFLTPLISSHVHEKDVASPAELAKAYMGSRPSKVSPSMLGLRSQALKEDANLLDNVSYPPKTHVRVGIPENGFMNPRSRGRSAIYDMARTPYLNVNPTADQKGFRSVFDGYGGPSASPSSVYPREHDAQLGSKQLALKRRISALEDDIGSTTPIRRLRQKTSLSTPQNLSLPVYRSTLSSHGAGLGSNGAQPLISFNRKPFPVEEPQYRNLHTENEDNSTPSTSYTTIPFKSSEMATRILEQLEKLVPREKPLEGDKSPSKLTPSMLRGQALRSLEYVDSSKILQNALESHKLEELCNTSQLDADEMTSHKQDKIEENGPEKFIGCHETVAPVGICGTMVSVNDSVAGVHTAGSVVTATATQPPQKKWAFHMSADEDFLDLDDEIHPIEATSTQLSPEVEKQEKFMVESKVAYTEAVMVSKTSRLSEIKPPDGPLITNSADLGTFDASVAGEKNTFTFLTVPASSTTFQPIVAALQSTSAFDSIIPLKESNSTPVFISADSKIVDKVPSISFSSSAVSESLCQKSNAPLESKPECSNSLANSASGTAIVAPKVPESDEGDYDGIQKSVEMTVQSEISSSAAVSASSILSFAAPAYISGLNNGSLASSPSIFSSPAPFPVSVDFTNQKIGNSFTNTAPSTSVTVSTNDTTTTSASNGIVSTSSAASSFLVAPIFNFGPTAGALSNPVSTMSTTSSLETTDLKAKTDKESTLGNDNLSNAPLGGTSFGTASTGSNIFGFSTSATSSAVYNSSEGDLFGTTSGSLAITQTSPAETGVATVTQSMPFQFGSSFTCSNSIFGSSSSSSPLFSSSTSPKLFDSTFSFGLSSSASSSPINTISPSGAATSSLFGTNWQPTTTTSVSPSAVFPFVASFVSAASTSNAPMVFSSGIPTFTALSGNGDQMSMEDSMSEDPVQGSAPAVPVFGQPSISAPSSGFMFSSTVSSGGIPSFQFGNQQNQSTPQMLPPFQSSGSLEFGAKNSFSLGSGGGGDKSGRKIVKRQTQKPKKAIKHHER